MEPGEVDQSQASTTNIAANQRARSVTVRLLLTDCLYSVAAYRTFFLPVKLIQQVCPHIY